MIVQNLRKNYYRLRKYYHAEKEKKSGYVLEAKEQNSIVVDSDKIFLSGVKRFEYLFIAQYLFGKL